MELRVQAMGNAYTTWIPSSVPAYRERTLSMEIKKMKKLLTIAVASAFVGLPSLSAAQTPHQDVPRVWLAQDIIGMKVSSQSGEHLGKIEDVVVHPGGEPSYAVLSFGGWLGMGDKHFAMPWNVLRALEADPAAKVGERSLVLPLEKERLKTAPGFDKKNWPSLANQEWTRDVDTFYKGDVNPNVRRAAEAGMRNSIISWRTSELKGTNVKTPTGEKLGDVKELAIDSNGRVSYVALSVGGFLGVGDKVVAVPWGSLNFSMAGPESDKKLITLASTKEQLTGAPSFLSGKEHCDQMCDQQWIDTVYSYYSQPKYWTSTEVIGSAHESNR